MRFTAALLALLAFLPCAARAADEEPKIPADGAPKVTTDSGLTYSVLAEGKEGRKPKLDDVVTVNYTAWLEADGKVFDASRHRAKPAELKVGDQLPGLKEALLLMSPGARWKLTLPPALAYKGTEVQAGSHPASRAIPANSTLVYEIELLTVRSIPQFTFRAADTAKQTTTASGLKVEVVTEGEGAAAAENDFIEVAYAVWTTGGVLVQSSSPSSTKRTMDPIKLGVKRITMAGLKEGVLLLKLGGRLRLEMPPNIGIPNAIPPDLPAGSVSVWEIELLKILRGPTFAAPDPAKSVKTASGLEIETVAEGTGKSPKDGEQVTVHYAGWLTNGTPFDSSFERGETTNFNVGGVIEGWNEALKQMKEGGKVRLSIPPSIAYGAQGRPGIPPNATLIFYVELIKVGA